MSELNSINTKTLKAPEYFSNDAYEYQFVPYVADGGSFVAITFFKSNAEADIATGEPKIEMIRKAICTITLPLDLAINLGEGLGNITAP